MARRAEITALYEGHLLGVLERLGVAEDYVEHRLKCSLCGKPIREQGLGALRLFDDEPVICCGRLECLERFHG